MAKSTANFEKENAAMKTTLALAMFTASLFSAVAQDYQVGEKGLHHRVWEKTVSYRDHLGRLKHEKSSYTELATGLMYEENGQLLESSEVIELFRDGAAARKGQHQVIFPANLNAEGIDYESIDKQRFRSQIMGLNYYEVTTGRSVLIAELKDCQGFVHAPNRVIYSDALTDVKAEVRYTYKKAGFAQDLILLENPPPPEEYGLDPAACRLEVFTEFSETIQPTKKVIGKLPVGRMGEAESTDEELQFGQMRIGAGKAFVEERPGSVHVGKLWTVIDGRQFLVESVDYLSTKPLLEVLPAAGVAAVQKARMQRVAVRNGRSVPAKRQAKANSKPMQMAQLERRRLPALVFDYEIINSGSTDFRFRADKTYYVSGFASFSGGTYFEGGCVIKYTNGVGEITVDSTSAGSVTFETSPARPIVFTSMHDNTIGATIASSTGNPNTNYCGVRYLTINGSVSGYPYPATIKNVRFSHAATALKFIYGADHVATGAQFVRCREGMEIRYTRASLRNGLFHNVLTNVTGISGTNSWENVTSHTADLIYVPGTAYANTNCLFVNIPDADEYTTGSASNHVVASSSGVFQQIGGGFHYLATNSPYRNAGTTNINATLLADLRKKTTYAPLVLSNSITLNTTLRPYAQRDTDVPDVGYHYDPIDYALGSCTVSDATLTLTNGVAVATFNQTSIAIYGNGQLVSYGKPERRNQICRYNNVQEQSTNWGNGTVSSHTQILGYPTGGTPPIGRFRFTDFSSYANGGYFVYCDDSLFEFASLLLRDCDFNSAKLILGGSEGSRIGVTNNLFHRVDADFVYYPGVDLYNNLFKGADCYFERYASSNAWTIKDNSFDNTSIYQEGGESLINSNNAYINCATRLTPNAANDVVTNSFTYHVGPLGKYYQPTNSALVDKGSITNAALAGLYHYSTATNAVKEANTIVDIGLHYVAANYATGVPLDYDGDGWGDWFEDTNGNGTHDSGAGETDWQVYNSIYGVGSGPGLQVFTPLR
jgi:hypothetical protein